MHTCTVEPCEGVEKMMMDGWWWQTAILHVTGRRQMPGIASEHLLETERIILAPPWEGNEKMYKRTLEYRCIGTVTVTSEWEGDTNLKRKYSFAFFSNIVYRKKGERERLYAAMVTAQMTYRSRSFLTRTVSLFFFFYPLTLQTPITYSPYYLPLVFLSAISVEKGRGGWGTKLFSYYYFFLLFSAALSAQVIARESLLLAVSIFCFSFSKRKEKRKTCLRQEK